MRYDLDGCSAHDPAAAHADLVMNVYDDGSRIGLVEVQRRRVERLG